MNPSYLNDLFKFFAFLHFIFFAKRTIPIPTYTYTFFFKKK